MIVVDTSALMAVLRQETEADDFTNLLAAEQAVVIGAPTKFELLLVTGRLRGAAGMTEATALLAEFGTLVVDWTDSLADIAAGAFLRFGKGRHLASLNYGDCMAYAVAKSLDASLLFKGEDFIHTDIESALRQS